MKDNLKTVPKSRAVTVLGLLEDVKTAILNEPARANMEVLVRTDEFMIAKTQSRVPSCGTVGCFAGWVSILATHTSVRPTGNEVYHILGEDLTYTFEDSGNLLQSVFNAGDGDACETTKVGTRAHARAVVARINRFIKVNAEKLKGRRLPNSVLEARKG